MTQTQKKAQRARAQQVQAQAAHAGQDGQDLILQSLKPQSADNMIVSVGPHHPSTHGVLRLVLELDGERIVQAVPEHGFIHTGIEKNAEALTWQQATTVIDRMDYLSPLSNNLGYVLAVEKLLGIEVPERCTVIRLIMTELQRIASHLVWLGTTGLDLGAQSMFFYCFDIREGILDIIEEVSGVRLNPSYIRIGGLQQDVPANFIEMVNAFLDKFPQRLKELRTLLDRNPIWRDRTEGVGAISAEDAIKLGLTGPNLRATGVAYDVRRAYPYCGYDTLDFDVPVGENGDVYDRYIVRILEMEQTHRILRQLVDRYPGPDTPWRIDDRKIVLPPKEEVRHSMEALIHHFKLVSYGFDVPAGEAYASVESPRGEIGFYVVSDGGNKPWRVRVRPPSFYTVHALPALLKDQLLADMVAVIATTDPVFGEVDR